LLARIVLNNGYRGGAALSPYVERIAERLRDAEEDLKREVNEQRRWQYQVHRGRIWFD